MARLVNKSGGGRYQELCHSDSKADVFPGYVKRGYPELAKKTSYFHTGYFFLQAGTTCQNGGSQKYLPIHLYHSCVRVILITSSSLIPLARCSSLLTQTS
jgi:hypothetical protein